FGWMWQQLPPTITGKFGPLATLALLFVLLFAGIWGATIIGPRAEPLFFSAREAAAPDLVSADDFKPINEQTETRLDAGDLRSWTSGGALLQREQAGVLVSDGKAQAVKLPKGWWLPGGHSLFIALMTIPFALGLGWCLRAAGAVLFGGKVFKREFKGLYPGANPVSKLRRALAGESRTTLWPIAVDVGFSLGAVCIVVVMGWGLSLLVSPGIEYVFFGYEHPTAGGFVNGVATPARVADFRRFITGAEGWKFNQTNSLVVGFAMGFAVIPIIYSIAEDALSTVPNQLRAASLACGASRWQTTVHVVMPAAASGIFSAIVIGLGRAIGETMIVVMAAGGTPVMDPWPLTGFRSLSAAIAIEMPEAPQGGSHYRTLFLGGLLLFCMTFVISSMAELVRMRLRKKLSRM
ncbi:partial Phosphate transport system permease protein PstC, partial [Gammaproteobacteria bacterium]